jgi:hypothetical protein
MKKGSAGSEPPFNTRKFWLSSAVFFAGILAVALLPSCGKAAERQSQSRGTPVEPSPAVRYA